MKKVFRDGSVGTTGLRIYERLSARDDVKILTLSEENKCELSFSMTGDFFYGTYSIEDDSLICKLTRLQGEYIKTLETNIEYHFSIVDEQTLEFEKVVGKVGKYVYTIDGTEYDFETQLSHFEEGETFVYTTDVDE